MQAIQRLDRRGMALPVAVFALVVIGALVATGFFVARLEQQSGVNTVLAAQAQAAAEAGLGESAALDLATLSALPVYTGVAGQEVVFAAQQVHGASAPTQYTMSVRRLNNELFLVRSLGERLSSGGTTLASAELGTFVRIVQPTVTVNAAITVTHPVKLNGNSFTVSGINANPSGWSAAECPAVDAGTGDDKVGIRSANETGVSGKDLDNVFGYPDKAVANDPTITSQTFRDFLDYTYSTLSQIPGAKTLPSTSTYNGVAPVVDGTGACDKTVLLNFGEPQRPGAVPACYSYFPVVHGTGTSTKFASGSRGQGTLLIDGDLEIAGGFEWTGLIIVRGSFKINGTGNKITGAVLAESVTDDNSIGGNVDIDYSSCAIDKAVKNSAVPAPVGQRGWATVYF